ncbi:MAG: ATP-binding protein [Faecalibacillus intestinalis]|uniref:ATP-binding protein n=1 Tax=Faecalibacillus intestinalis TaxID=1982626 RepID=UPI00399AF7EA
MKKIIITIGKNSQTIFLLIVLVIGLVILLNMIAFFYKKHKNPRFSQKEFLNNIFYKDQSQVYVLVRKKDYKVLFLSSHFEEVFHILPKRIQVDIEVLKEIVEDDTYRQFLKEYKQWNQQEPFKYSFKMKDENKWFILTITAIEHGKYHLFAFYDHSEDVLKELDYLQQIETTKNESEYKASFLSRMSHEIRTPMNGIIGMLTLARQSKQDAKQGSYYLQQAEDISKYLLSLINEVLDMSRMEAGKLELESKPFNIYHLKAQLNNIFKETIEKKNVLFKIDYFDFDAKYFMGDELRIMQILVNLLSNASKFTDNGEITVTFRQMYKEDKVANIMMRVHDTGKGMSREFLSHIFRPFEQEGVEISKKYGGSGLGMAITDQLVKLMGGEIVVDSLEGKGTDFTVFLNLPVAPSQEYEDEKEVVVEQFSFEKKRILLAEDNEINAEICMSVLNSKGAFVERVENGQEAVDTFKKHTKNYYDLILMDIQMPQMDGYEATQIIRTMESGKAIPIFALSADAYVENKRYSKEMGMDGHFSKPIDFDVMEKELSEYFSRRDA